MTRQQKQDLWLGSFIVLIGWVLSLYLGIGVPYESAPMESEVTTPEVTTPEVTTPAVTTPAVTTPEVTTHTLTVRVVDAATSHTWTVMFPELIADRRR